MVFVCLICLPASPALSAGSKPRIVLMHDPELDDQNTLIRYLLYSNEFQTEGLIYTSSGVHWAGDGKGTLWFKPDGEYRRFGLMLCPCTSWRWKPGERFIDDAVAIYAQVYPNLRRHAPGYPSPATLRARILTGNIEFDGDFSQDSPGSNLIRRLLLDDQPRPVYLLAGGGQSTIARALKSIELQYQGTRQWPAIQRKVSRKAIIRSFADQDGSYTAYIKPNWPDIDYRDMATRIWGYSARSVVPQPYAHFLEPEWMRSIVTSVGPLGAFYRVWGDGKQMVPGDVMDYFGFANQTAEQLRAQGYIVWTPPQAPGGWISEGDTSIFMNLIGNGLRAHEDPAYGGWGGRSGVDHDERGAAPTDYAAARWFGAAQQDFAARLRWTVTPAFSGANHAPIVRALGRSDVVVAPGRAIRLQVAARDADGDSLRYRWWPYRDAGSYTGPLSLRSADAASIDVTVPLDAQAGQTIHLIAEVTDDGSPSLAGYRRFILTVAASPAPGTRTSTSQ